MSTCKRAAAFLWLVIFALVLNACTEHKPVPPPQAKINPTPKDHYRAVLTIIDDPGTPIEVESSAGYAIANMDCIPVDYTRSLGGSKPQFAESVSRPVAVISKNAYAVTISADHFIDEDYYGFGVCRWVPMASFRIHRAGFSLGVAMSLDEMIEGKPKTLFCPTNVSVTRSDACLYETAIQSSIRNQYFRVHVQAAKE